MVKNKLKNVAYSVGFLVLMGGLFAWPIINDKTRPLVKAWNDAGVGCLSGHQNASQHIHQQVTITVDGKPETLVGEIGIVRSCMAESHVHSGENNLIHVESADPNKKITLGQFFVVYGKPLVRDGYNLEVIVNDKPVADPANLVLEDKQVIEIKYTTQKASQ